MNRFLRSQYPPNPRDLAVFDTTTGSSSGRTRWLKLFLSLVMITITSIASAQVSAYTFAQTTSSYADITGATTLITATSNAFGNAGFPDEQVYSAIPIGFSFTYNNLTYTTVHVSANGYIVFGGTAPSGTNYTPISNAAAMDGVVAAMGGDCSGMFNVGGRTSTISYVTTGSAPNRTFTVQYKDYRPAYSTSTTNAAYINYQIQLDESTNAVRVVYGSSGMAIGATNANTTRQIGLRGASNTDFNNRTNTTTVAFSASTVGTVNTSTQAYSTVNATPGRPIVGQTYTWLPPAGCSGTPNSGSAVLTPASGCSNSSIILSASGLSTGPGLSFQWESSTDGGTTWNAISGATTASYTLAAGVSVNTSFRLATTCTNSGLTNYSSSTSYTINTCAATITMIDSYGDGWNGATMTLNVNGSPYLVFGSTFTTGLNQTITACLPENAAYTLVWTSGGSFSGEVGVSIDVTGNANYTKPSGTGTVGSTLTTGTSCPPGCTGTPNGGITSATGSAVCNGTTVTFTNSGYTFGTGISYSWEFSTDGTNFAATGATNPATYSVAITTAGYYRLAVTCANSNTTSYSNNVQVTLNAPLDCYCQPTTTYGCADGDVIARVILNTLDNNSGTGCPSDPNPNDASFTPNVQGPGYSNYTTNPALTTTLLPSTTYSCIVYAGQYAEGYAAWIDYNDNGVFETTERIGYSNGTVAGSGQVGVLGSSATFPVVIDCNPPAGPHRMRVRAMYATNGINVSPCANNSYGEIEDYTITIAAPPVCPSPGALTVSATTYNSVSLTWPLGCSTATNYDFEYGPTGFTPGTGTVLTNVAATIDGATNTGSYTITGLTSSTTYQVYYRANCGAETSAWSFPASFSTPVAPPTISSVDPVQACPGATVTVTGTDFVNITSVTVGGVAASYTVASATSISVVVPMTVTAGLVSVDVTNAGGTAQGGLLTFAAASTSISGSSAICAGSSATLTASGSGTFSWMNYPCVYSIELEDTFGDGWNGGTVDVVVDGVVVLDNLTVGSGYGPAVSNFAVSGTNVSIVYTAGSWSGENHYTVYAGPDATGAVLFASTVGATPPATQAISTTGCEGVSMGSGSSISATTGGAYGVTLTDANGCQASASTTLTVNPVPTASTATAATVCYGSTVTLSATETTGLAGVTFEWFDIAATSVGTGASYTTNPVYADDYYYVVASTATCSSAPAFTGVVVSALSGVQLTAINITCNGAANGSFSQTQVCGTAPYAYSVVAPGNPAGTFGALPTNLAAGTYSVYVQDANNNVTLPIELVITEPAALTAVTTTNAAVCAGVTEGIVTATLANVTSSVSIGDNLNGDGAGALSYTANINLPAGATVVSANIIFTDVTSSYMTEAQWALSGAATTSAAGFPSTGWGLQTIDFTTAIPVTSGGALTLTLTDTYDDAGIDFTIANATVEVTYTSPNTIAWFADAAATQLIGIGTSLDVVGTTVAAEPATSGTYTVYAAQYDGTCYGPVTAATLEVGAPLAVDITAPAGCTYSVGLVDSYGDGWNGGSLTVLVDGVAVLSGLTVANGYGPEFHNFSVTPGQTIVMNYTAGQWAGENSYVVYDGADGVGAVIYTSTAAPAATASITNSCSGGTICPGANQTLTANITGGGAPYSYVWSTGDITPSITVAASSTPITVTVTDACGTVLTDSYTANVASVPTVTIAGPSAILVNDFTVTPPGSGTWTISGFDAGSTFTWNYSTTPTGPWTPTGGTSETQTLYATGNGGTIYLQAVANNGCPAYSNALEVVLGNAIDSTCNAYALTAGNQGGLAFSTAASGLQPNETAGFASTSIWFTFVAPASGRVSLDSYNAAGSDNYMTVYSATDCNDLTTFTQVASDDDSGFGANAYIANIACLTPGQTYYVQVRPYSATQAAYVITLTELSNSAPTIANVPANITLPAQQGQCGSIVTWVAPTLQDDQVACATMTSNYTSGSSFPLGTTTVTYTATDGQGLTATASFTVTVNDLQLPTITAPAAVAASVDAGTCSATNVTLGTPTTADNCSVATVSSDAPATFPVGTTTVTWTVVDAAGNTATATQDVVVTAGATDVCSNSIDDNCNGLVDENCHTFSVDMTCAEVTFTNVYVTGPWCGWCGADVYNVMTDPDADGIYTVTVSLPAGNVEYKYMVDNWASQENLVDDMVNGASCAPVTDYFSYANRQVVVGSTNNDVYGRCSACDVAVPGCTDVTAANYNSSATVDNGSCLYATTFNVDMSCADAFTNVYVTGPWCGWCAAELYNVMTDVDGDGIYSVTLNLAGNIEYKYMVDNWASQENLVDDMQNGGTCAPVTDYFSYANRTTTGGSTTNDVYGRCSACPVLGCTDAAACNYDATATQDDGSCVMPALSYYVDADNDGFGAGTPALYCTNPGAGYSTLGTDCNDALAAVNPNASENCSTSYDDNCNGSINEGCVSNLPGENPSNSISMATSTWPNCFSNVNSTLAGMSASSASQTTCLTGEDKWYQFVATTEGVSILVNSTQNDILIELQTAAGTLVAEENAVAGLGTEILNFYGLTAGQVYKVGIRNYDSSLGIGTFSACVRMLKRGGCDYGPGPYSLCQYFKAAWAGSGSQYRFTFTGTSGVANGNVYTKTQATDICVLSTVTPTLPYGSSYNVLITNIYTLQDGAGTNEVLEVPALAPCTLNTIAEPVSQLRAGDRCSSGPRFRSAVVASLPWSCGAINWRWEFVEVDGSNNPVGLPIYHLRNAASNYLNLGTVAALQYGKTYAVRTCPIFTYTGTNYNWGPTQYMCIIGQSGMVAEGANAQAGNDVRDAQDLSQNLNVYPNPTNGTDINIQLSNITSENVQVRVLDAMGRVVFANRYAVDGMFTTNMTFDRPLANGLYMIEASFNGEVLTQRMMVQK